MKLNRFLTIVLIFLVTASAYNAFAFNPYRDPTPRPKCTWVDEEDLGDELYSSYGCFNGPRFMMVVEDPNRPNRFVANKYVTYGYLSSDYRYKYGSRCDGNVIGRAPDLTYGFVTIYDSIRTATILQRKVCR